MYKINEFTQNDYEQDQVHKNLFSYSTLKSFLIEQEMLDELQKLDKKTDYLFFLKDD